MTVIDRTKIEQLDFDDTFAGMGSSDYQLQVSDEAEDPVWTPSWRRLRAATTSRPVCGLNGGP